MKSYLANLKLREKLLNGSKLIFDNVSSTMGPGGNLVFIHPKGKQPFLTKDGWTVAAFLEASDPFENLAVQVLKQSSLKTNMEAGDGSTQSIVLSHCLLFQVQKYLAPGVSLHQFKAGMEQGVSILTAELKKVSKKIKDINDVKKIATISANGDESIGNLIAKAIDAVGKDGLVQIQDGKHTQTTLDLIEGFRFNSGFLSPRFINNEKKNVMEYNDPLFFITDHKLDTVEQMLPVLDLAARQKNPLIIIADEVVGQALACLIANTLRGSMEVGVITAPRFGEERRMILSDIAVATGATFFSKNKYIDFKNIELKDFGKAKSVESSAHFTTIVKGYGLADAVKERVNQIKQQIQDSQDMKDCERHQERIARLQGGISVISVGGNTDVEIVEKKHRIEDALNAAKSAMEEGVVPGGGSTLLRLAAVLDSHIEQSYKNGKIEYANGMKVVQDICKDPFNVIMGNAR